MIDASRLAVLAGLTCRVWEAPPGQTGRTALLLHGRGGDESSMAVFRAALPEDVRVVSPRALLTDTAGGFAWVPPHPESVWPVHEDFATADARLTMLVDELRTPTRAAQPILLAGFSQGAAMAAAFALEHRARIAGLALLAGFVARPPDSHLDRKPLFGLPVFVAYGTADTFIPPAIVDQSIALLRRAGGSVTTCDSAIGHKVSAACLRSLRDWLAREWAIQKHAGGAGRVEEEA
jgi:phospholipase/carboxylesterase